MANRKLIDELSEIYNLDEKTRYANYDGVSMQCQVHNRKTKEKFIKLYEKNCSNKTKYDDRRSKLLLKLRKKIIEKNQFN